MEAEKVVEVNRDLLGKENYEHVPNYQMVSKQIASQVNHQRQDVVVADSPTLVFFAENVDELICDWGKTLDASF